MTAVVAAASSDLGRPRVLVLVLASDNDPLYMKFQEIWRRYMHRFPDQFDAYFYKAKPDLPTDFLLEGNTLWIRHAEGISIAGWNRLLMALGFFRERLAEYDFVFRPNLSSFLDVPLYLRELATRPREKLCWAVKGAHGGVPFPSGSGFTLSSDLARQLVEDMPPFYVQDDVSVGKWLMKKRIPISVAPRYDFNRAALSFEHIKDTVKKCRQSRTFHYRVRTNGDREKDDIAIHETLFRVLYSHDDSTV